MSETPVILSLRDVVVPHHFPYDTGLEVASFELRAGDLALVRVEEGLTSVPLADIAQGLITPEHGEVLYNDRNWHSVKPDEANALRATVGRVFERFGWISNLDVDENVSLEQLNHTSRSEAEIEAAVGVIAKSVRLDEIPHTRPAATPRQVLRRSEWVRALLDEPLLLLLERPTRDLGLEWTDVLAERVKASRAAGAAAIWLTDEEDEWNSAAINPTLKFRMTGSKMQPEPIKPKS